MSATDQDEGRPEVRRRGRHAQSDPVDDEPVTAEVALPRRSEDLPVAASGIRSAARGVVTLWTSSKGWRERHVLARLPRWEALSRRRRGGGLGDVTGVAVPPPAAPPAGVVDQGWVPVLALVVCFVGVVGLTLPLIEAADGTVSFAAINIPYIGMILLGGFLVLSLLPVVDIVRRRVCWTAWLVLPALLGVLPLAVLLFTLASVPRWLREVWADAPERAVEVGSAAPVLLGSDLALVVVGVLAIAGRVGARRTRRTRRTRARQSSPRGPAPR